MVLTSDRNVSAAIAAESLRVPPLDLVRLVAWHECVSETVVMDGIRGRFEPISSSVLCGMQSRPAALSRVTKPVRRPEYPVESGVAGQPAFRFGIPAITAYEAS